MMSKESAPVKGFGSFWARWGIDYQKKETIVANTNHKKSMKLANH
jgi:hypothetical protein